MTYFLRLKIKAKEPRPSYNVELGSGMVIVSHPMSRRKARSSSVSSLRVPVVIFGSILLLA